MVGITYHIIAFQSQFYLQVHLRYKNNSFKVQNGRVYIVASYATVSLTLEFGRKYAMENGLLWTYRTYDFKLTRCRITCETYNLITITNKHIR